MRHEPADDGVLFAAVFHIQEAEHGEHDRADEVDDEIFHRVDQADIEIAAEEVPPARGDDRAQAGGRGQ